MFLHILKSKLKCVVVTDANVEYQGSLTIDKLLMQSAGILPNERVEINSVDGHERIVSYAIEAPAGSGRVELNGGAANHFKIGDRIHVNCFAMVDVKEATDPEFGTKFPIVVHTKFDGERNYMVDGV